MELTSSSWCRTLRALVELFTRPTPSRAWLFTAGPLGLRSTFSLAGARIANESHAFSLVGAVGRSHPIA